MKRGGGGKKFRKNDIGIKKGWGSVKGRDESIKSIYPIMYRI